MRGDYAPVICSPGPVAGLLTFQFFLSPAKRPTLRGQIYGKISAKSPRPPEVDNNEQQMTWTPAWTI